MRSPLFVARQRGSPGTKNGGMMSDAAGLARGLRTELEAKARQLDGALHEAAAAQEAAAAAQQEAERAVEELARARETQCQLERELAEVGPGGTIRMYMHTLPDSSACALYTCACTYTHVHAPIHMCMHLYTRACKYINLPGY